MGSIILLLALFLVSVILGADAWRSREEEINDPTLNAIAFEVGAWRTF